MPVLELGSTEGPSANGAPCTPVLSAQQAGIPEGLRFVPKTRFLPRFGFAYRPFSNDKTVVRGGFGAYNVIVLGNVFYSLTGTLQSDARQFLNPDVDGKPTFAWPNINAGGSGIAAEDFGNAYFGTANAIRFKDPYSFQWNLSVDRDLGHATGVRVSYIGQRTVSLVWAPDLNESYYSTEFYAAQPLSRRPFPNWGTINTRTTGAGAIYNAGQVEVSHRLSSSLQFNSTYTYASNLADNQGPNPSGFAGETAGGRAMDLYNRNAEYGPVYATRRHRWITTASYELPFGRGRAFGQNMSPLLEAMLGGWRLTSSFLAQSGPHMTPTFSKGDPSGTGSGRIGRPQHPDRLADGNLSNPTRDQWADPVGVRLSRHAELAARNRLHDRRQPGIGPGADRSLRRFRPRHHRRSEHYQPLRRTHQDIRGHRTRAPAHGGNLHQPVQPRQSGRSEPVGRQQQLRAHHLRARSRIRRKPHRTSRRARRVLAIASGFATEGACSADARWRMSRGRPFLRGTE